MGKRTFICLLLVVLFYPSSGQTGGDNVYEFLNLTHSGLVSSLGGSNVSIPDDDLNMAYHNPALLSPSMNGGLALNYVSYLAGINYGMAMYSRSFTDAGNFAAGIMYLNYGSFTEADPSGNITGSFGASEYSFSLIWSLAIDSAFSAGVNVKPVVSHLERYTSLGFAVDIGASWHSVNNLVSAGLVIRNIGYQVTTYAGEERRQVPFEIQAGGSARLAHAPLRFSLTLRHLEKYDLTYDYEESGNDTGADQVSQELVENLMRHVIIATELLPHKNFYLSAGYNYQRRRELQISSRVSGVGLSWGFGINTSVVKIEFGRASYHLAGSSNHISIIVRPELLYRRRIR